MTLLDDRRFLVAYAGIVLFTGLASDALRNALSWYGFGAIVVLISAASVILLVHHRRRIALSSLPLPLLAFLALATVSIVWSFYPLPSMLGVALQIVTTTTALAIAVTLGLPDILRVLGVVFRLILGLSLLFELVVSLLVRAPVLPVWVTGADRVDPPLLLYWSRNLLFEGDRIQGIVGSSSLLAMAALLGLVVFSVQLAGGSVRRASGVFWIVVALGVIALTRSATIILGLVAVIIVLGMILLMRRATTPRARLLTSVGVGVTAVVVAVAGLLARGPILAALGKSEDLTGRLDIWAAVIELAQQRPVFGWGWISFWAPWVEPFKGYILRNGVVQLHAHDAWLDVWLQLGFVGLAVFGVLVASTAIRSFSLATDRSIAPGGVVRPFDALSVLAPLLMTALIVQSVAESRILVEGGWMLLTLLATTTKLGVLGRSPTRARNPLRTARR